MAKKKRIGMCSICGRENVEVTDDHVPPKTIFLKPRPNNEIGQNGELVYKYVRAPERPLFSFWVLVFYNSLIAAASTIPRE